jgi:DNA polymerase I
MFVRFSISAPNRVQIGEMGKIAKHCASLYEELQSILGVYHLTKQKLSDYGLLQVFQNIEMPLSCLLSRMEFQGLRVSLGTLDSISRRLQSEIRSLEIECHRVTGQEINLSSPDQVAHLLFDTLHLVARGQSSDKPKRHQSTSEEALLSMRNQHPVVDLILDHR